MSHTVPIEHLVPELVPDGVRKDDPAASGSEIPVVAPPSYDEPVVTRRELWSYYRTFPLDVICDVPHILLSVYYNGDNVSLCTVYHPRRS
jgi:hypothetical protein